MCDFTASDGDAAERLSGSEGSLIYDGHNTYDPQLQEMHYSESQEQSVSEKQV